MLSLSLTSLSISYLNEHFPNDVNADGSIPGLKQGKITRFFRHSDNAGSHFKNTGAIHYFTTLIEERGEPSKTLFVYTSLVLQATARVHSTDLEGNLRTKLQVSSDPL